MRVFNFVEQMSTPNLWLHQIDFAFPVTSWLGFRTVSEMMFFLTECGYFPIFWPIFSQCFLEFYLLFSYRDRACFLIRLAG